MVDYKLLADNDPGGDLQIAFEAMKAETVTQAQGRKLTYLQIANEVDFATATALQKRISALVVAGTFPEWLDASLKAEGVNINDPQIHGEQGALNALVGDGAEFSQVQADAIAALKNVTTLKYSGLKLGHLETARAMRLKGDI